MVVTLIESVEQTSATELRGHNTITEDGQNTAAVNSSTVTLNGEVAAVDDKQFGFVKDAELKDRDGDGIPELMVKFDGDETRELLRRGGNVKVTVTGRTVDDVLFTGSDRVRVVHPGNGKRVTGRLAAAVNTILQSMIQMLNGGR